MGEQGDLCRGIKEHTQTSAVSKYAHETASYPLLNDVKFFIERDPYWYTLRVRKAIHKRLHSNNISGDDRTEIAERG